MKTFNPLVRLYYYSDAHRSYGDAGTFRFVKMTEDCFSAKEDVAFNGQPYTTWNYTQKGLDFVKSIQGFDTYTIGFKFTTQDQIDSEINTLKNKLKIIE